MFSRKWKKRLRFLEMEVEYNRQSIVKLTNTVRAYIENPLYKVTYKPTESDPLALRPTLEKVDDTELGITFTD